MRGRMTDAGHPARHGFRECTRCGTWRRAEGVEGEGEATRCIDVRWCGDKAGQGTGRLEVIGYDADGREVAE